MASEPAAPDPMASPDVVRACMAMTAAGVAVAVLPYALLVGLFAGLTWWHGTGPLFGDDDATGIARVLLLCTLVGGLAAVGLGVRAAWGVRDALGGRGRVGVWVGVVAAILALWCWPPFQFLTSAWMLAGATLATRPLRWALAASGPLDREDVRGLRQQVFWLTMVITVLAHVAAWTAVVAAASVVPREAFARVESIRRGEPVERRPGELTLEPDGEPAPGFDVYDRMMTGATAAGRCVGGDMSMWQFAVGHWPEIAQAWIAPAPEGPTYRESWAVAALAFVLSLAFWLPATALWTFAGMPEAPRLEPRADRG